MIKNYSRLVIGFIVFAVLIGVAEAKASTTIGDNIVTGGNIGIGTTTSRTKVEIYSGAAGAEDLLRIGTSTSGDILTVTKAGNVGIGTTNPNNSFQVKGLFNVDNPLRNVSIGNQNMTNNVGVVDTTGFDDTSVGVYSLANNTTGYFNTSVGSQSMAVNTTGSFNTSVGRMSMYYNSTASANTAMGFNAMLYTDTGDHNTCVGVECLVYNTTGLYNDGFGAHNLHDNTSGIYNSSFGSNGLFDNTTGSYNTSLGESAGFNNVSGQENIFIGSHSGTSAKQMTNGTNSMALGANSFYTASNQYVYGSSTVADHIFPGGFVGIGVVSPSQQLEISQNFRLPITANPSDYGVIYKGSDRFIHDFNYGINGTTTTVGYNTFVGIRSGNFSMGAAADFSYEASFNTGIGYQALTANTTGSNDSGLGYDTLFSNTLGSNNVALGSYSLYSNTAGSNNSAVGYAALDYNTTGSNNSALGLSSGRFIADGTTPNRASSYSVYLGDYSAALFDGDTNEVVIGSGAIGAGSNSVVLGNDNIVKTILKGEVGIGVPSPNSSLQVAGVTDKWTSIMAGSVNASHSYGLKITAGSNSTDDSLAVRDSSDTFSYLIVRGDGFVGIGTSSPVSKLDVNGNIRALGGSAGHATCWKTDGKTIGYCSTAIAGDGTCTCN